MACLQSRNNDLGFEINQETSLTRSTQMSLTLLSKSEQIKEIRTPLSQKGTADLLPVIGNCAIVEGSLTEEV